MGQNPRQSHWGGLERTAVDPEAKMFKQERKTSGLQVTPARRGGGR